VAVNTTRIYEQQVTVKTGEVAWVTFVVNPPLITPTSAFSETPADGSPLPDATPAITETPAEGGPPTDTPPPADATLTLETTPTPEATPEPPTATPG
jgi:hypothetical protein